MQNVKGQPFGVQRSTHGMLNRYRTYFAAPGASGAACSRTDPGSIYQAVALANSPGDTVILRGGRYDISGAHLLWSNAGTAAAPIITQGADGEDVVLQAESLAYDADRDLQVSAAYNILKNFRVESMPRVGVKVTADNVLLDGLEIVGCGQRGIETNNSGDIKNCVIASCGTEVGHSGIYVMGSANLRITNTVSCFNGVDGFEHQGVDGGVYYTGCVAYGNANNGWTGHNRITLRQCVAFDNGADGINAGASAALSKIYNCSTFRNVGAGFGSLNTGTKVNGCISYSDGSATSGDTPTGSDNSWNLSTAPDFYGTTWGESGFLLPAPQSLMTHMGAYSDTYRD